MPKVNWSNNPIMQYAGLKDKNGKEIYEGDIMTHPDFPPCSAYEISFENGRFTVGGLDFIRADITEGVIVGNIFENPLLLLGAP